MTLTRARECLTEAAMVATSAAFLAWYLAVKLAMWPWGAFRLLPW